MEIEFILFVSFMLLFTSLATLLNTITMVMIIASSVLRKKRHVFTFNLALSDCTASVIIMVLIITGYKEIEFDDWWIEPTFNSALIMSILTSLLIALYRFIVFRFDPHGYRNLMSGPVCTIICVVAWAIVLSAYFLVSRFHTYDTIGLVASPIIIMSSLVITAIIYSVIYYRIVVVPRRLGLLNTGGSNPGLAWGVKRNTSILGTFALIVVTNFACWVIICAILLMEYYAPEYFHDFKWFVVLGDVGFNLVCVNGVLNPIIYWTRLSDFRRHLTCCCPGRCGGTQDTEWAEKSDGQTNVEIQSTAKMTENKV